MKRILCVAAIALLGLSLQAKTTIFLKLDKVVKTPASKEFKPEGANAFGDDALAIVWDAAPGGFQFELTNKGESALSVLWDECSFINESMKTSKIARGETGPQSEIAPGASYEGMAAPANYLFWSGKNWVLAPIFKAKLNDQEFAEIADKDLIFKVMLALKKDGKKVFYLFVFKAFAR